jgi:uncharacterized protein
MQVEEKDMSAQSSKRYPEAHPYVFSLGLIGLYIVSSVILGALTSIFALPSAVLYIGVPALMSAVCVVLLTRLGWWKQVGFRAPANRRDLIVFWLPALFALIPLVALVGLKGTSDNWAILGFLVAALLVGFAEETIFRGLILRALLKSGIWRATLISGVVFGLMHSLNVLAGSNPLSVGLQICYAAAIGFGFSAAVLRTGLLWPLIITHALQDFLAFIAGNGVVSSSNPGTFEIISTIGYVLAFTVYGIVLLRSVPAKAREPRPGSSGERLSSSPAVA